MRVIKLTFFLLIFSLIACNKENDHRIIEPGSYFPVYPGSWWKYIINDSTIIKDSISDDYFLNCLPPGCPEQVYVPYYYSASSSPIAINGPVYKYQKIINYPKRGPGSQLWPVLSETLGYSFAVTPYEVTHYPIIERATIQEKKYIGQDSILVITCHFEDLYGNDTLPLKRHREFIKNIGLSMNVLYDTVKMDTVYKSILLDYFVNK